MDTEFEKGKRLLIEGLDSFIKLFDPYLKIFEGMRLLDIPDLFEVGKEKTEGLENAELWKIVINSFLSDMREAKDKEAIHQALEKNRDLMKRLL